MTSPRFSHLVPRRSVREYQAQLQERLSTVFPSSQVEIEWPAMSDERNLYSPRLDAAVGPFAIDRICIDEYDRLIRVHEPFLLHLFEVHRANLRAYGQADNDFSFDQLCTRNLNARCFMSIEIENMVSRKHLMGGAINAAALGRIGLAVAWNQEKLRAFIRMRSYLLFLAEVGKNTFNPSNLIILSAEQFMEIINSYLNNTRQPLHPRRARRRANNARPE